MGKIRLLIVDDVEDNRLVLNAICRRMDGFEIKEAVDGIDAISVCEAWQPQIVLMDVMMPNMDGFEASKIIKKRFPETIIMVVTAVIDPQMESNMASIGVVTYLHKPIDKELVRFKLQSFAAVLRSKVGKHAKLTSKEALNPFCRDVRHFKTIFDVQDAEGMMDFGIWVLTRCEEQRVQGCSKVDPMIELFYILMRQGVGDGETLNIIIEESFEEMYITMKFDKPIELKSKALDLVNDLETYCVIRDNTVCVRLNIGSTTIVETVKKSEPEQSLKTPEIEKTVEPMVRANESIEITLNKEVRTIDAEEKELLRQSFLHKTTAADYIQEIGGDVLEEIRDLESLDREWFERLSKLESEASVDTIRGFADGVLGVYVRAINNLFEFTALAYALSSLGTFMKEHAEEIINDSSKVKTLVMLTEHLGHDLASWREHIFGLQDAADIHYLDSSFFSSCMQIEQIIGNKNIESDDDNDMEFF